MFQAVALQELTRMRSLSPIYYLYILLHPRLNAFVSQEIILTGLLYTPGQKVPAAPSRGEQERVRTYKTKGETNNQRTVFTTIVVVLLVIAFIVPMLQFYGYTSKN